jgi:hypothetical protein
MLAIYRTLLYLYPSAYRDEYGEEMMAVFCEVREEMKNKGPFARVVCCCREVGGLLGGALQEHGRCILGSYSRSTFSSRRLAMRTEFRFPKATVTLMVIILVGVVMAINKGKAIQASVPYANPHIGPIQPAQFTVLPSLMLTLVGACLVGAIGWVIMFALHRSGVQRFSKVDTSGGQHPDTKLSI